MARAIRVEFDGAIYHVTARGNERRRIFRSDADRRLFLATLEQMIDQCGAVLHAYCLMPNHYHLVVTTPRGNLTQAIGWFQTTYTIRYNRRHQRSGHLFQGRFKAHLIDADAYAQHVVRYVHLNPVRPRDKSQPIPRDRKALLAAYPWSSHRDYAGLRKKPVWLNVEWLSYWGTNKKAAHRQYRLEIQNLFGNALASPWSDLRGGLVLGGERLWARVKGVVQDKQGHEEIRWQKTEGNHARRERLKDFLVPEDDRRIHIWARVKLGGERPVDVGRELGYRDGSGVLQVIKRLEHGPTDSPVSERLAVLKRLMSSVES